MAALVGCAAAAQAVSGFGYALLAVPLLSAITGSTDAVVISSLASLPMSPLILAGNRHHVDRGAATRLIAAGFVGMPLGLVLLDQVSDDALRLAIGGVVIVLATLLATGFQLRRSAHALDLACGFVSGVLSTSTGTSGPPLVFGLQARRLEADAFRSTLAAVFVTTGAVSNVVFVAAGKVTRDRLIAGAVGTPFVLAGVSLGRHLAARTTPSAWRRIVLGLLYLSAASAIVSAVG